MAEQEVKFVDMKRVPTSTRRNRGHWADKLREMQRLGKAMSVSLTKDDNVRTIQSTIAGTARRLGINVRTQVDDDKLWVVPQ